MFGMFGDEFDNDVPFFLYNPLSLEEISQNHEPLFGNIIQENSLIRN
jgi:hypothetical protein